MAKKARLELEGNEYIVLECEYEIKQETEKGDGQPSTSPSGGDIIMTIVSPDDRDLRFHEWMISKIMRKDGVIKFEVVDDGKPAHKTLTFEDAYCTKLKEIFNDTDNKQMYMKLSINAGKMIFGSPGSSKPDSVKDLKNIAKAALGMSDGRIKYKRW